MIEHLCDLQIRMLIYSHDIYTNKYSTYDFLMFLKEITYAH